MIDTTADLTARIQSAQKLIDSTEAVVNGFRAITPENQAYLAQHFPHLSSFLTTLAADYDAAFKIHS